MPKTRSTTKENKSKAAEQKRKHRSSLTPEKKKEVRDRERAARNLKKKIEKDPKAIKFTKILLEIANPYLNELLKEILLDLDDIEDAEESNEDDYTIGKVNEGDPELNELHRK